VSIPVTTNADIFDVIDGTWPAARYDTSGPFTLRLGQGGGNRVSAATQNATFTPDDLPRAENAMRALGQDPLFMIRPDDIALDAALDERGYAIRDEVMIYTCSIERLCDRPLPRVTVFTIWQPLAIMTEIWAKGGIGPGRLAVMERAQGPKTGLLARLNEKPGGTGYVAIHNGIAMLHALEILPHQRAQGLGGWMMRGAALWAKRQGAHTFSVICTTANTGANALYASLGMDAVGTYHYRYIPKEGDQS
jgi:GNAT superfamily N-acetyltransferase